MGQIYVFLPSFLIYLILFPLIWILLVIYLVKQKHTTTNDYFFALVAFIVPFIFCILLFVMKVMISYWIIFGVMNLATILMSVISYRMYKEHLA
ncbi:hypothetical protein GCM10007190_07890 [Macrococcus hajekii]|nr:hypothetical protein GCM10007190_07890 [Macrococcus hajekii]